MTWVESWTRRLGLEPHERRTLLLMGVLVMALMCAYTLAKVLRDALFLTEFHGLALPYAYIGVALASAGFVWLETRVQGRFTRNVASRFSQYVAIGISILTALVYPLAPHRTAAGFYLWTGSQVMLLLPHFWLLALEVWDSRRARFLFPVLGGCGLVGGMVGGGFAAWSLPFMRPAGLMWVLAGLLILAHLLTRLLESHRANRTSAFQASSPASPWRIIRSSKYIQILGIGLALSVIVSTLVDFQFKILLQQVYTDTGSLTRFLGKFYIVLNAAALLFQVGAAGWLMHRFGLAASTGLQPTAVMLFAPVVAIGGGWWGVVALRWVQGVVFQTFGKPSAEIYYAAIRPNERRRIKPTIDTLAERWSDAIVGLLLILVLHVMHAPLTAIAVGTGIMAALWMIVLLRLNRYYGRAFRKMLSSRWLEPEEAPEALKEPAARKALFEALASDDERATVLALELCRNVRDPAIARGVYRCLRSPSPAVVTAAVETMEAMRVPDPERLVEGFLQDSNESLRRAAVGYLLATHRQPVVFARKLLEGEDSSLRRYVVDALFERPHVAPGAVTPEWIDARILAGTEEDLVLAARGLGSIRGADAAKRLQTLLAYPNVEVRRAALQSAARRPRREFLDVLLDLLMVPELALEAREAVAAIGAPAVPRLRRLLAGERGSQGEAIAARTLAHIGSPSAIKAIAPLARSGDVRTRQLGLQNLRRARVRAGRPILTRRTAHRLFLREIGDYRDAREPGLAHASSKVPEIRLLAESFLESAEMALERAIAALSCAHDPRALSGVFDRLRGGDRSEAAPALEYLSQALPRSVFRHVSKVFETMEQDPEPTTRHESVSSLIEAAWSSDDAWLRACAVRASRHVPDFDPTRRPEDHPLVRAELQSLGAGNGPAKAAAC